MKILFFGLGIKGLYVLNSLISHGQSLDIKFLVLPSESIKQKIKGRLQYFLKHKVTPEYEMKLVANKNRIPIIYYNKNIIKKLKNEIIDLGIIASFNKIFPEEVINFPTKGTVNIHSSTLPSHRGANPIFWAIRNGEKVIGTTIHFVSKDFDRGEIILQDKIEIDTKDSYNTVEKKLLPLQVKLLTKVIDQISNDTVVRISQNSSKASYDPVPKEGDYTINWNNNSNTILNLIRASDKFNGAITYMEGKIYRIMAVSLTEEKNNKNVGTVIRKSPKGLFINTKDIVIFVSWKDIYPIENRVFVKENGIFTNRI